MHIMCTLYHTNRQYANIRPHGRDEKLKKIRFYLTFHINISTNFYFFNKNQKKQAGRIKSQPLNK